MGGYSVTTRIGGRVERQKLDQLEAALTTLERKARELEASSRAAPTGGGLMRRFEPVQQVGGRIELAAPRGVRAGVDVRGDGSSEAFTGRVRRKLVAQQDGESPYDALRRVLR